MHAPRPYLQMRNDRNINFFMTDNAIVDDYGCRLSHPTFKLYIGMCRWTSGGQGVVRVGYDYIQERLDLSSATVSKGIKALVAAGLLRVERTIGEHGKEANIYLLQAVPAVSLGNKDPSFTRQRDPSSPGEATDLQQVKQLKKGEEKERGEEGVQENEYHSIASTPSPFAAYPPDICEALHSIGIESISDYIRRCGRGIFSTPESTLDYARRHARPD